MHKYKQYTRLFVFSIIAFIFLFPIIYLIVFSVFHSDTGFSLMNYYKVFLAKPDYLIKFWRSLAMCLMIAAGQTLFSCMSGTAFAKYSFPLKKFWFILFALFMILPIQVTLLPNYILLEKLKLLNSWKALIIPAIFSPFGTVWLTFVFQAIPDSTLDAARMDGVNQLQMIRYIIVPNSKPAVITLFILVFTESWNMVEQPMHKYKQYTRLFVFSIIAFIFLFPIIYLIVFSVFHSDTGFSLMNYYKVFLAKPDYLIKFWRSLAMCLMIAAGQTLFSCMSGTAFAKYSFPLKKFWFILFALFMILPIQVTLLPNYILLEKLKLLNSWKALIIPAIFSPFGTVWLTFVFQAIPDSTLDAARMDGVNQLQMIRYIIVPNSKPAVITLFILVFTESWNMVEQPILFLEKETDYPLSVFLASLNQNAVGIQSVCGLLCLLPVTFFFLYYNTELTDGLKDILWS